jgi:hypothetical protein
MTPAVACVVLSSEERATCRSHLQRLKSAVDMLRMYLTLSGSLTAAIDEQQVDDGQVPPPLLSPQSGPPCKLLAEVRSPCRLKPT